MDEEHLIQDMDVIDVKNDTVYIMIHSIFETFMYQIKIPSLQLEEKMSLSLHEIPESYVSTYFQRSSLPDYPKISRYDCYRNLEGSYQTMEFLSTQYPTLVQIIDIGPSHLKSIDKGGHEIKCMILSNKDSNVTKAHLFVICSIHARELAPSEACARFAEDMLESYGTDADKTWILDYTEIHIILQGNPDGRELEEQHFQFRRKNVNCQWMCLSRVRKGVDLNRNFPFQWGMIHEGYQCSQTYAGRSGGSEKETEAITNYVESVFPTGTNVIDPETGSYMPDSKGIFIDIHSYGRDIFWPYAYTSSRSPNDVELRTLAKKMASFTSPTYSHDNSLELMAGLSMDWAYGVVGLAAFILELGTKFHQECSLFEKNENENAMKSLLYAARVAHAPFKYPLGPDVLSLSFIAWKEDTLTITLTVSDSGRAMDYDLTGSQHITAMRLYIDTHPYEVDAVPVVNMTQDFDSVSVTVTFDIPISNYSDGDHTLFVQADDTKGPGPVYSDFFQIPM